MLNKQPYLSKLGMNSRYGMPLSKMQVFKILEKYFFGKCGARIFLRNYFTAELRLIPDDDGKDCIQERKGQV